jgi:hypothetical protein
MSTAIPAEGRTALVRSAGCAPGRCSGLAKSWQRHDGGDVELVISQGRAARLVREVRAPVFLIGANRECDLVLGDSQMPAVHSYIYQMGEGVRLRHLGAPPEIRVNGRVVQVIMLNSGDLVDIGPFQFQIRIYD